MTTTNRIAALIEEAAVLKTEPFLAIDTSPGLGPSLWESADGCWTVACWDWEAQPWRLRRAVDRTSPFKAVGNYRTLAGALRRMAQETAP